MCTDRCALTLPMLKASPAPNSMCMLGVSGQTKQWRTFDFVKPDLPRSWAAQPCLGGGHAIEGSAHLWDLPRESTSAQHIGGGSDCLSSPRGVFKKAGKVCSRTRNSVLCPDLTVGHPSQRLERAGLETWHFLSLPEEKNVLLLCWTSNVSVSPLSYSF